MSQTTISKIKSYGIIIKKIPENIKSGILINNYRWKIYGDFLCDNKDKYKIVFTSDIRDTFFQLDVFQFYNNYNSFLGVAIEDGILTDQINKQWIINIYGLTIYEKIKNERIICSGTVWGTTDKFYEFSKMMWRPFEINRTLGRYIYDQGIANYLIYYDKKFNDSLVKSDNINGRVMTVGLSNDKDIKFDSENNVLNGKGEIAAVVHQYDRKPNIIEKVKRKYCYKWFFIHFFRLIMRFQPFLLFIMIFGIFIATFIIIKFLYDRKKKRKRTKIKIKKNFLKSDDKLVKIYNEI